MKTILETKMEMVKRHRDFAEFLNDSFNRIEENQKEFDLLQKDIEEGLEELNKREKDFEEKNKKLEKDIELLTNEIDQLLKDLGTE